RWLPLRPRSKTYHTPNETAHGSRPTGCYLPKSRGEADHLPVDTVEAVMRHRLARIASVAATGQPGHARLALRPLHEWLDARRLSEAAGVGAVMNHQRARQGGGRTENRGNVVRRAGPRGQK